MRTTQQFSITLPNEMAKRIREKVAAGEYATESEVIRDGLRVLLARDQAMQNWLQTEVAAAYDEVQANPASVVTSAELRAHMVKVHDGRSKE